jgi:uncharacterized protein YndB with AHSA1/START domain
MVIRAERGMPAPPEVVFNTATDPVRLAAWLPRPLRLNGNLPAVETAALNARWSTGSAERWSAALQVQPGAAGGSIVRLELAAAVPDDRLVEIADRSLADLARHVADNFTPG